MNLEIYPELIQGVSVGFEIVDDPNLLDDEEACMVAIDLLIFRLLLVFVKDFDGTAA